MKKMQMQQQKIKNPIIFHIKLELFIVNFYAYWFSYLNYS